MNPRRAIFAPLLPQWRSLLAIAGCISLVCSGCAQQHASQTTAPISNGYVPIFTRMREGFRPILPYHVAEVTYWNCQSLPTEELSGIHNQFARPLVEDKSRYHRHIGAVVVDGGSDLEFTIWLMDGRRLNSKLSFSYLEQPGQYEQMARQMYSHALTLLRHAVSDRNIKRAENAPPP